MGNSPPDLEGSMSYLLKHPGRFVVAVSTLAVVAASGLVAGAGVQSVTSASVPAAQSVAPESAPVAETLSTKSRKTRITKNISSATISRYGTNTSHTFQVKAVGTKLHYKWQQHSASSKKWKTITGAKSSKYVAKASAWSNGTRFRVIVTGKRGKKTSKTAKLTVLYPTKTPAKDAASAFHLSGLRQGVDLSSYQYVPSARVNMSSIKSWAGTNGFTILRNGSGARPINTSYTNACTNKAASTGSSPVTEDCAYATLADAATAKGLKLGGYWFNGWISNIDTTSEKLFANGYTPTASANQFVTWLEADGNYTGTATNSDPIVLDIEAGSAWTKTSASTGKKYKLSLRAWNSSEALEFLTVVKSRLSADGYSPNLYVYMGATNASRTSNGAYVWKDVAAVARLWVAYWGTDNGRVPSKQPSVGPWSSYGGWSLWQYTSNNRISGSGVGALDSDIAKSNAWVPR
jgi:hypothetical protein